MYQTKLIQLLKSFDKNEIRQFESFLEAPYFNTSKKTLAFYKILIYYYPDFESPKLSKERVYQKMHGHQPYSDPTMRDLITVLFRLAKEFVSHQELKNIPFNASNNRYVWFVQRGLTKISEQELIYCDELLHSKVTKDYEYYYQRWIADYNENHYQSEVLKGLEHKLSKNKEHNHHLRSLDKYYLLHLLGAYIYQLNMAKIYNAPVDSSGTAHIEELGQKYTGSGDILIDVFYNMYQLLKNGDEKHYFELKSIFLSSDISIEQPVMTEVSINLQNYCMQKLREGDTRFGSEIMEIYRFVVDRELMTEGGKVPYSFYKNAVITAVDFLDIDWAKQFAEKYRIMLPPQFGDEVYNFSRAYVLLAERKFDEALNIAMYVGAFNDFTKLDIKNLVARIHYELGMFDQLYTLLNSYAHHLNRETMSISRKENNRLFASFMKQLADLNQQYSLENWKRLSAEINQTPAFTNKRWFQEKMTEMSGKG